jgi:hypothetical protein
MGKLIQFPGRPRSLQSEPKTLQPNSRGRSFYSFAAITADLLAVGAITEDMAFRNIQKFLAEQGELCER